MGSQLEGREIDHMNMCYTIRPTDMNKHPVATTSGVNIPPHSCAYEVLDTSTMITSEHYFSQKGWADQLSESH